MVAEQILIQKLAPDDKDTSNRNFQNRGFDNLMLIQKLEVFRGCLAETKGDEIAEMLWLRSPDAETWVERRNNYCNTLACMSMVGYILGLGDRHPSNLMMQQLSGKVVHIDFGDCFEVAMLRDNFPELVPFRLTRLLVRALEVCLAHTAHPCSLSVLAAVRNGRDVQACERERDAGHAQEQGQLAGCAGGVRARPAAQLERAAGTQLHGRRNGWHRAGYGECDTRRWAELPRQHDDDAQRAYAAVSRAGDGAELAGAGGPCARARQAQRPRLRGAAVVFSRRRSAWCRRRPGGRSRWWRACRRTRRSCG